jgi:putative membrane protein
MKTNRDIWLILKGAAMGIAEVIPGVSGGTIAFITGIYETLIDSIKSFHPRLISIGLKEGMTKVFELIHARFILLLITGMLVGVIIGVFGVSHLIETDPEMLWGFFFGLIIASAIFVAYQLDNWSLKEFVILLSGFAVAASISFVSPAEGSSNLIMIFIAGFIAISAMLLPGISGSFILLLLGMYTLIIPSLKSFLSRPNSSDGLILSVFAVGCVTGLATFSRILSWTFKHYKDQTLAALTGFMLGSLFKIWPWRNPNLWIDNDTGIKYSNMQEIAAGKINPESLRLLNEINVSPSNYYTEPNTMIVILAMVVGFCLVYLLGFRTKKVNIS